ncbi:hypothetical protein HX871_21270 [Pseudomonas reactans]|uniref:Uncharacterized protein n=1 Tax=Pseudomonas reactans TaxID=117680 RepID=A0ABX2R1K3_9PSED|nr:hypothetical protein [Pseudomonas reactans]NWD96964.1 hypothetical protein [Pseudomonas reactans]
MKPIKAKLTDAILYVSGRFPFLVSRRLRYFGRSYNAPESSSMIELRRREQSIKKAGLFSGKIIFKGVSLVAAVDGNDLKRIHNWMRGQNNSAGNYSESHGRVVNSTDLTSGGSNNLGFITFGEPGHFSVGNIALVANLPKGCYVTTLRLQKGVTYLSLYFSLHEAASEKIFDVDVSMVQGYKCFGSLNPFSPRFSVVEHHDRQSVIDEFIFQNTRDIVAEVNQALSAVLQVWGVKKKVADFSSVADFCRDGAEPYFVDDHSTGADSEGRSAVFERWRGKFFCTTISEDTSEQFLEGYVAEQVGVDGVFIKNEEFSTVDVDDRYLYTMHSATEYYTYFMCVSEADKQFKRCMSVASPIFLSFNNNARRNLKILINASLGLNLVQERVAALQEGISWSESRYHRFTHSRLAWLKSKVEGLKSDVEKRKDLNNSELQLSNLLWTKRYSVLVGFLVLVQIALSLVAVDWTESGKEKNPIYLNLFKDSDKTG